jgi:transposase
MEATGAYYEEVAYFLYEQDQDVCVALANKVKHYAKSLNVKTKTDKVDAGVIADFGMAQAHPKWKPMAAEYRLLRDLCRELLSMKKESARAKCQLHAMRSSHGKSSEVLSIKLEQLKFYEGAIARLTSKITQAVEQDGALKRKVDNITKVHGLGLITVAIVLCETNGFQSFSSIRQVVSYAGLDVAMKESGAYKGKASISKKGNARLRQCLFMPALSATVHNANIRALYERVVERNPQVKRKGVVAAMRKLLVLIFVLWKKEEPYSESYRWGKSRSRAADIG